MSTAEKSSHLAHEPDFMLGRLRVSPATCRVVSDTEEIRVEPQTMSVLIALSRAQGATVSKAGLIDACWQGRVVSDDAVTRTIAKVRALARATTPEAFVLETLPKVGYRLSAPADANHLSAAAEAASHPVPADIKPAIWGQWRLLPLVGTGLAGLAVAVLLADGAQAPFPDRQPQAEIVAAFNGQPVRSTDVMDALLNVDVPRLRLYIRRGWNVNWHLDSERNAALHQLMMACERNRHHDKAAVLRVAQFLVRSGADVGAKNKWGDTPLFIASTPRYCGPDHPVVAYLREQVARPR